MLEAEEATITGGAIGSSGSGFTGTGYASITSESGGTVSWSYEAPSAGYYMVEFRYAMQAGDVDAQLAVNGTVVDGTLSFWGTGSNSIWQAETRYVELNAGANTITLSVAGEVQAIDHVNLVH